MVTEKFSIAYLIVLTRLRGTNKKGILSNLVVAALPFSPHQCWRDDHTTRFGGGLGMAMAGKSSVCKTYVLLKSALTLADLCDHGNIEDFAGDWLDSILQKITE